MTPIEQLYPLDYRFIAKSPDSITGEEVGSRRRQSRAFRNAFFSFLTDLALFRDDPRLAWLKPLVADDILRYSHFAAVHPNVDIATREGEALCALYGVRGFPVWKRVLWALAQHYDLSTALLDLTCDIGVAAWFATNHWCSKNTRPLGGTGVIYRYDIGQTMVILSNHERAANEHMQKENKCNLPPLFIHGMEAIPQVCALRPFRQQGASSCGFDQQLVVGACLWSGAVEVYEFPQPSRIESGSVDRSWLCPEDDPFFPIVDAFKLSQERGGTVIERSENDFPRPDDSSGNTRRRL